MGRPHQIQDQKAGIVEKINGLDFMLNSLDRVHKDNSKQQEDLMKKISTRKLLLMDELFKLLSHLSVT